MYFGSAQTLPLALITYGLGYEKSHHCFTEMIEIKSFLQSSQICHVQNEPKTKNKKEQMPPQRLITLF